MIDPGDTSPEMGTNDLSPDLVEQLLADPSSVMVEPGLHAAFAELRELPAQTPIPSASPELAEFVHVPVSPIPEPVLDLDAAPVALAPEPVPTVRRSTVVGEIAAFLGTVAGKVCVGTTVVAASFGGAVAADVVDVPFVEDEIAEVQTIDEEERDAVKHLL